MINKLYITFFLLFSLVKISYAQNDSAKMAGQIIKIEQALADVLPVDSAFWSKYLDPKWHIVDEDGNGAFKKEFLETFKPWPKTISIQVSVTKPVFAFHGNIAVVQYIADEYETAYGQKLHTTYGTMDVWYKTDTSWRMLSMQDFEIPSWPPAIKPAVAILKKYTGTYQLTDENIAVISLKNDTLYIQKNKRKPEALFAETADVFFRKSDARGRKFFVNDASGNMQMLERRNGQDLVWKKIK
jgi:hypothetical protein